MIKYIFSIIVALYLILCIGGCNSNIEDQSNISATDSKTPNEETIDQERLHYIVRTDWMTFLFSKKDFQEDDINEIANEAVCVMQDVREYLNANYNLEDAENTLCYFNSSYRYNGEKRSECFWNERKMYCISLDDFVHEYVHMVSENNADIVYHPVKLFSEGLAQYVSLSFYDGIASRDYVYFTEVAISQNSNISEHQMICDLLAQNELSYSAENYNKAFVALLDKSYDVSKIEKNTYFYKYYIGQVFVDYCINRLGGLETFIAVYCDSVTIVDVYGKNVDKIVTDACTYNTSCFFDTSK